MKPGELMGFLDRLRASRSSTGSEQQPPARTTATVAAQVFVGDEDLEVVGEASYQDALWSICQGAEGAQVHQQVVAVLVPEPQNPYDANAISVQIEGRVIGYLSRENAMRFR